jgi:SAM-dependent methyltransferase
VKFLDSLEERALLMLRAPAGRPGVGATVNYTIDNCLNFARSTLRNFDKRIAGPTVLDYGCGPGWQAVAIRIHCGAAKVFGLDIRDDWLVHGQSLAERHGASREVQFGTSVPDELAGHFDVVLSLSAFEHYRDPAAELARMRSFLGPGGGRDPALVCRTLVLAFGQPLWRLHPHSGHEPACSVAEPVFSDRALLALRAKFRPGRPARLEDIEGGLNKMTLAKFRRIVRDSGLIVGDLRYFPTLGLPLVSRIPAIRELLTSAVSCALTVPA